MTTQHPLETQLPLAPIRPFRCFRHRPWMASCDDCRKAHSTASAHGSKPTTAAR